jgi:ABC-type amino acid transport/signal transduction systems, periplasmic component/domain
MPTKAIPGGASWRHRAAAVCGAALLAVAALGVVPAAAQTLDNVLSYKKIKIGVLLENAPFGFIDQAGTPVGFNIDVANLIVERLGDDIEIEVVPTTNASRIANLTTGGIDMAVATISMLPERAEVIQFSKPYTQFENIVVGSPDRQIAEFADLSGLRIGVGQGSTAETAMLDSAPSDATVQTFADRAAALQALQAGQVDVIADDSLVLVVLGEIVPGEYEKKFAFSEMWVGVGLPKGQPDYLERVNAAIDDIRANGQLLELHQKWLSRDLPEWPESLPGIPF